MTAPYFDPAVATFFRGLTRDNSREWFTAHRDDYERLVRAPLEDLAAEAGECYGASRVFRPNRDVRFSKDKSPYKSSGSLWAGDTAGVYLQVDVSGIMVGGGMYEPASDQLRRARTAIDQAPRAAAALREIVETLESEGFEMAGPSLKTAPRDFAKDHPDIDLLRLRHYAALRTLPLTAGHADIAAAWRASEPLIAWAETHVGPSEQQRF